MAEEVGFEPTEELPLRRFSRPVHSTALSLLRVEYEPYLTVTKALVDYYTTSKYCKLYTIIF